MTFPLPLNGGLGENGYPTCVVCHGNSEPPIIIQHELSRLILFAHVECFSDYEREMRERPQDIRDEPPSDHDRIVERIRQIPPRP